MVATAIARAHPGRFVLVPEAATQVYHRLQTRWDKLDLADRRDVQRQIYRLQVEQEANVERQHPGRILLLDRGTIDGAAYWPDGSPDYWQALQTTPEAELSRYHAVIWLETVAVLGLYDGEASNPCRFEHPEAAIQSGRLVLQLWGNHPRLKHVGAFVRLADKIEAVKEILCSIET